MATAPIHLDEKRSSGALSRSRRRLDSEDLFRRSSENVRGVFVAFESAALEFGLVVLGGKGDFEVVDWLFGEDCVDAFVVDDDVDDCVVVGGGGGVIASFPGVTT